MRFLHSDEDSECGKSVEFSTPKGYGDSVIKREIETFLHTGESMDVETVQANGSE